MWLGGIFSLKTDGKNLHSRKYVWFIRLLYLKHVEVSDWECFCFRCHNHRGYNFLCTSFRVITASRSSFSKRTAYRCMQKSLFLLYIFLSLSLGEDCIFSRLLCYLHQQTNGYWFIKFFVSTYASLIVAETWLFYFSVKTFYCQLWQEDRRQINRGKHTFMHIIFFKD